jgi:DNA-directed RNA polymerase subunit RPC12/RpoP
MIKCLKCGNETSKDFKEHRYWIYCPFCGYEVRLKNYTNQLKIKKYDQKILERVETLPPKATE